MKIHLIWAQDENGGIGKNEQLPWHISEDLKNFKRLTLNSTILMGRKTWESLPFKPLPKRRNVVLSSQKRTDVESYPSIKNCLSVLEGDGIERVFVIGGAQIYSEFFPLADELHITKVNEIVAGIDTYFPIKFDEIEANFTKVTEVDLTHTATYFNFTKK